MKTRTFSPVRKAVVTFAAATLAVTLVACGSDDDSQGDPGSEDTSKEPDKFVIAAGGVGVYNATPYIAEVEGYFEEAGLEVTINQAGSNTLNLVVGGQADVGMIGATTALFPVPNGKETSLIYANDTLAGFTYFGSSDPDVKTVNDCKKVSTGATGTSTFSMASLVKQKAEASYEITPSQRPTTSLRRCSRTRSTARPEL
ncbi:MAG: ABC transporter substrate-binding protein [Nocardioidaceae bacterium]|nr:MAG: ABC transporter substrate-binding protein [Nocardioidaceae bacterium]